LDWEPKVDLESGLKLSLDYFRNQVQQISVQQIRGAVR